MKKEDLTAKGLSEEMAAEVIAMVKKGYVTIEKYNSDTSALNDKISSINSKSKAEAEKYCADIKALKIDNAVNIAIAKAGAKTEKAVKALIDIDKISVDESGKVKGIDEQIKGLAEGEDTKYLFNSEAFKGVSVGSSGQEPEAADISKMSYTEMCAYLEKNPDVNF